MEHAGFWRRLGAIIIDLTVILVLSRLFELVFSGDIFYSAIATFFIQMAYFIGLEGSKIQATLGKFICKIYIADKNNKKENLVNLMVRFLCFIIPVIPAYAVLFLAPEDKRTSFMGMASAVQLFLYLLFALPMFFTKNKSNVIDLLSRTRVLNGRVKN